MQATHSAFLRTSRARTTLWLIGVSLLIATVTYTAHRRYNSIVHPLPTGCDEFGYLQMAKAISEGNALQDHVERPFFSELRADLKEKFPDKNHYRWMIAPHAYHISDANGEIRNQYPPGVGLILALFSIENRRIAFPVVCVALGGLAIAFAARLNAGKTNTLLPFLLIPASVWIAREIPALNLELMRVNSLAPTFGLLVAAGMLLSSKPIWSLFLLSLTFVFRIPNALLLLPVGIACVFLSKAAPSTWRERLNLSLRLSLPTIFSGLGLYFAYVYFAFGNPLAPTYAPIDRDFASSKDLIENISFYFTDSNAWLWPHLLALGAFAAITIYRQAQTKWLLFATILCLFNYAFYLTHKVKIDYYPYATVFLTCGLAIQGINFDSLSKWIRFGLASIGIALATYSLLYSPPPQERASGDFALKAKPYREAFSDYDVIWAEHRSGTIEYTTNCAGFRYNWGPEKTRSYIIRWLRDRGYRQAIWTSDIDMDPRNEVEALLADSKIPFTVRDGNELGPFLEVMPTIDSPKNSNTTSK